MNVGSSVFLIAVGAVLRYAVTLQVEGLDIQALGMVLMAVGGIVLLLSLQPWGPGGFGGGGTGPARDPITLEDTAAYRRKREEAERARTGGPGPAS